MSSNLKVLHLHGWEGGLNDMADETKCLKNQLRIAENVKIMSGGVVGVRPGLCYDAGNFKFPTFITSIWAKKARFPITVTSGTGLYDSAGVLRHTYTTDNQGQFEFLNDTLLHSNGTDIMQQWDGITEATSDVVGSPRTKILLRHNDRIFGAVGSVLYETLVNSATNFADGAATNIGLNEGGSITGLGSLGGDLYIFKEARIYRMTGYAKNERQVFVHTDRFGTAAGGTIKPVNLKGFGEVLMFVDSKSRLCMLNNTGTWDIGEYVQNRLNDMVGNRYIRAEVSESQGQYMFLFGPGLESLMCLHFNSPYETPFGTRWGITTYPFPFCPSAACETPTGLLIGTNVAGEDRIFSMSNDQRTPALDQINESYFRSIPITVRTADLDAGNINQNKQWRRGNFRLSTCANYGDTVIFSYAQHTDQTTVKSGIFPLISDRYWEFVHDNWVELTNSSKQVGLELCLDTVNQGYRLHGIDIMYRPGSIENRA